MGDLRDRAHVGSDVLAGAAVSAGGGAGEPAVLVREVDREAVDLEFAQEVVVGRADVPGDAVGPGGQLGVVEGVVEGEHALAVLDGGERRGHGRVRTRDLLRRRVGRTQLGVLLLQRLQGAQELVELAVADDRLVLHVVPEAVPLDLLGELRVLLPCRRGHLCGLCVLLFMRPPSRPPVCPCADPDPSLWVVRE